MLGYNTILYALIVSSLAKQDVLSTDDDFLVYVIWCRYSDK